MSWLDRERLRTVWVTVRVALDPERIRGALTRNLPLKLLALLISFSLWVFVHGEKDTEDSLKVPLELRSIPAHLVITSPRVDFIDLRVSGPRVLLGRIDRSRLSVALDLTGVRPGPAVFRVDTESLPLPRGVKVVRVNPAQVTLEFDRMAHKSVPVRIRLAGKPPADLQVAETKVSPETVQVAGPASDLEDLHAVNTEPIDVTNATPGTIEREVPLEPAGDYVSFSANRVAAQVHIEEVQVTREFKHVPITVHNAAHLYRVTPDQLRLTLRGPKRLLDDLELDHGAVYIDAQGEELGEHSLKPNVELPSGVELVSADPGKVQLLMIKERRSSRGRR
jgi:YbbR-like protein